MEYGIHNGPIQWQISTSIKVILENFSLALTVFELFTKFVTLKMPVKVMMYNIHSGTFDGKYLASYLMAIVMFALSLTTAFEASRALISPTLRLFPLKRVNI